MARIGPFLGAAAVVLLSGSAFADERLRTEARTTALEGDRLFESGRCDKAIALWKKADAIYHAPTITLRIARCQALLGKVVEATASFAKIVDEPLADGAPPPFADAKESARRELPGVRARIARLTIKLNVRQTRGLTVSPVVEIDQRKVSADGGALEIDPGDHLVKVSADRSTWEKRLTLDDGERRTIDVALWVDPPASVPRVQRTVGLSIGAAGLASLVVGASFGISAFLTSKRLDEVCGDDHTRCPPSEDENVLKLRRHATVADVAVGTGAALVAAGVILVVTEPKPKREGPVIQIVGGLGRVAVGGVF